MQSFPVYSYAGPIEVESVSNVTLTPSVQIGETRFFKGEEYVYVYNAGVQQISQSQFATLSANSGYSVTVSSVTMYDMPFGFAKHATIGTAAYGWLLTRGFTPVALVASNSAAVSDILYAGGQGLCGTISNTTSFTTGANYGPVGYVVGAAASGASGGTGTAAVAYVRCFGG